MRYRNWADGVWATGVWADGVWAIRPEATGAAGLALGAAGVGVAPTAGAREGAGVVTLGLGAAGVGQLIAVGRGVAALALSGSGVGARASAGYGAAGCRLGATGLGENGDAVVPTVIQMGTITLREAITVGTIVTTPEE
jgi:hypothetical protein